MRTLIVLALLAFLALVILYVRHDDPTPSIDPRVTRCNPGVLPCEGVRP